jgi:hypothetical protein
MMHKMHTRVTQIVDEYAKIEQEEIRLLKAGALPIESYRQKAAFLSSIDKDYEALVKDKGDPSEESVRLRTIRSGIFCIRSSGVFTK